MVTGTFQETRLRPEVQRLQHVNRNTMYLGMTLSPTLHRGSDGIRTFGPPE